jgi:hypothetical protein
MADDVEPRRPFSDDLLQAAARIEELPPTEVARLLVKAAVRLRVIQQTGVKLEHIPVEAYHLLRSVSRAQVLASTIHGRTAEEALNFLLTRQLATVSSEGVITITASGEELGEVADERSESSALEMGQPGKGN